MHLQLRSRVLLTGAGRKRGVRGEQNAGGPIQTVRLTFSAPLLPTPPGSPRWYRKRSSHTVRQWRQIAYNNRPRPFIFPRQRFAG